MRGRALYLILIVTLVAWASGPNLATAQTASEIEIDHTPPAIVLPGLQVNLTAVLTNATEASVTWNNGSMSSDSQVPMTNTSERSGSGWVYGAWLPAESDGVQVSYSINASNSATNKIMSYFLVVSAPSSPGLTGADQDRWMLTMAATMSMGISTLAVLYWYMGRRLRKER